MAELPRKLVSHTYSRGITSHGYYSESGNQLPCLIYLPHLDYYTSPFPVGPGWWVNLQPDIPASKGLVLPVLLASTLASADLMEFIEDTVSCLCY